ncbi:MAG: hypothetical protein AUJ55_11335 [Proteobacteria bacterium CG1_02_64_396]|nr:MAG: hypothetical protein AUJ55_11335 [Proteobacteria bacterium CG1_02_64_396]
MYVGVAGTLAHTKVDTTSLQAAGFSGSVTEWGVGGTVFVGSTLSELGGGSALAAEVGYLSSKAASRDMTYLGGPVTGDINVSGLTAAVLYRFASGMFLKVGAASITAKESLEAPAAGLSSTDSTKSTSPLWGIGFDWMANQQFGVRLEIGGLTAVKDSFDTNNTVSLANLGLLFRF